MFTSHHENQQLMNRTQLLVNSIRMEHRLKREEVLSLSPERSRV